MTKENIFRIALICFNTDYDKIKDDPEDLSVRMCDLFLPAAESTAARLHDWSFLTKRIQYNGYDRETYNPKFGNLKYAYPKPSDMLKPLYVDGDYNHTIRVIEDTIYFDVENPELTYMSDKVDYQRFPYPDDYGYILAFELAFELCDMLMPDKAAFKQGIAQKIELKTNLLISSDTEGYRDANNGLDWIGEIKP